MYCGSCLRDNRVAATLLEQGRDVVLMPLYTPIRTDETDVSTRPVHYGGLSLYLAHKSPLLRRMPGVLRRLLDSESVLRLASRLAVRTDAASLGALTVDMLQPDSAVHHGPFEQLAAALRAVRADVIHLPTLLLLGLAAPLKEALGLPLVCTLAGEEVFLDGLPEPHRTRAGDLIRGAADNVDGFIAPTRYCAQSSRERFGLDGRRVHYVPLGVRAEEPAAHHSGAGGAFVIGYLARIAPEKGLAELVEAFIEMRAAGRDCVLRAAGYLPPAEQGYLWRVRQRLAAAGQADRFTYLGEVDRPGKLAFLAGVDCLSVPAPYPEAKGNYVVEALAAGVPVALPRRGAFVELVEDSGGGILCDAHSVAALAAAISMLMDDPAARAEMGRRGREAVRARFTADIMAEEAWKVFQMYARR
jgi:glycosyltransferase involved in cell wall biosynthesis